MDNTPGSDPVQMDSLKAVLNILHTDLSQQVTRIAQVSQDQIQGAFMKT